jgi:hypothetical protein
VVCTIVICCAVAVPLVVLPALQTPPTSEQNTIKNAVTKAINYIKGTDQSDALLMLNVIYRRFGIQEFANAVQHYDQILANNPYAAPTLRVFRRIAVHDNPLHAGDMQVVTAPLDLITAPALYCDLDGLPSDYGQQLMTAIGEEGYYVTHVLLACIWIKENGCSVPPPVQVENVYRSTASLINNDTVVTDLELEAASFLYVAGQGSRVDRAFIDNVLATQNADGGWSETSGLGTNSYYHASVLGLLLLLHVEYPKSAYPPMLSPPTPAPANSP